jgi:MtN3 and saliva related transmembrane protein
METDHNFITYIGFLAGACTTFAFLPQAVQTWKTKSAKDISLGMYLILCSGVILWVTYGILITNYPIIVTNVITLMLAFSILYFKLTYRE